MDTTITTDPDGEEETTTQDSPPTVEGGATAQQATLSAEGGAIAKQAIQPIQTVDPIEESDEQQQAQQTQQAHNTAQHEDNHIALNGVPGDLALDMIEEQALKKQEDKELFHTPVTRVTQEEFTSMHNKTRRSFQDVTGNMASTRAVYDNYLQAKSRLPLLAKVLMEDILPPHAYTWHVRNALAFKAAIVYLKKDRVVITGPNR